MDLVFFSISNFFIKKFLMQINRWGFSCSNSALHECRARVANKIENCKTFTSFIYGLHICFTTRNCSTLLTLFVFLVIFTASQLHLVIMGHLIQGILLLNALGIIICVSSVIDIWCKKKLAIFERIVFLTVKWWK